MTGDASPSRPNGQTVGTNSARDRESAWNNQDRGNHRQPDPQLTAQDKPRASKISMVNPVHCHRFKCSRRAHGWQRDGRGLMPFGQRMRRISARGSVVCAGAGVVPVSG